MTQTKQCGVHSCLHPTLGRQYSTNYQILRYKRMPDPIYADTLKSGVVSKQGNNYVQSYCTSYGWSCCHPMAQKSEYHDTLSSMFKCDGILPKMIVEKSRDKSLGAFVRNLRKSGCHLINSKPYSP